MNKRIFLLGAALFCLAGCLVPSLHPLYTETDKLILPGLAGDWLPQDDDEVWSFQAEPDSSYALAYIEGEDTSWFVVHLVNLDGTVFMDMYPDPSDVLSDAYKEHLVGVHTFCKIEIDSSELTISILDSDWLRSQIDSGKVSIRHDTLGPGDLVLTANTDELQQFMRSIAADTNAFVPSQLTRLSSARDSM